MTTNTTKSKSDEKHQAHSCCGGKASTPEKTTQQVKPLEEKPKEKSSCCSN